MTAATSVSAPDNAYVRDLQSQLQAMAPQAPELLFVCSSEPQAQDSAWERTLEGALFLRTPGARLHEAEAREALHYAVSELGIADVWLVLRSRCSHRGGLTLVPPPRPDASSQPGIRARAARAGDLVAAACDELRKTLAELQTDPRLSEVRTTGLVQIVESGVLLAYDAERDSFEAVL